MLNFRLSTILFLILIVLFFVFRIFYTISWFWLAGTCAAYFFVLYWGSSRIYSGFHFDVICHTRNADNSVVISFDDGPDPEATPAILDILQKHEVKAVFFVIGRKAIENPRILRRIHAEGHVLGNHSYSHANLFSLFFSKKMVAEITHTTRTIFDITGVSVRWFRPPYGVTNPRLKRALKITGLIPVGWSLRTFDSSTKDPQRVMKRLEKVSPGDIILFHDSAGNLLRILDDFLKLLKRQGYSVADPEQSLGMPAYK